MNKHAFKRIGLFSTFLLTLCSSQFLWACGKQAEFPFKVISINADPFTTQKCYPIKIVFSDHYHGYRVNKAFVQFLPELHAKWMASPDNFEDEAYGEVTDAHFEAELQLNPYPDQQLSVDMCLSVNVAATTRINLTLRDNEDNLARGVVSGCFPPVITLQGISQKIRELSTQKK